MASFAIRKSGDIVDTRLDPRLPWAATLDLNLPGGVAVSVHNDLSSITAYVLAEQEDWFEPELAFVRSWFGPGMRAFDVGANHGIYALTLARLAGPAGSVVAFEPGSEPRALLERGIERNGLGWCEVVRSAVADRPGEGRLYSHGASEGATLAPQAGGSGETVRVTTLDSIWAACGEPALDFLKLDVEGFELPALAGARRLLAVADPLVMFEISGERARLDALAPVFSGLGYALYRLLPGPGVLVAAVPDEISTFQVNLFAAKPERAASLAAAGLLLPALGEPVAAEPAMALEGLRRLPCWDGADGEPLRRRLDESSCCDPAALVMAHALRSRAASPALGVADRRLVLATATDVAGDATTRVASLSAVARCATETGARPQALAALGDLQKLATAMAAPAALPFLPTTAAFDALAPGGEGLEWLRLMAVDALVTLHCHSTRFTRGEALGLLEHWRHSRFFGAHLERRRQLLAVRFGRQSGLLRTDPIRTATTLNPDLYL
ncbi:MAG: FkbM family methyltransferase [Geminicoccaceae bacterium]